MKLSELKIPNSLSEIEALRKEQKHLIFKNWCVLHYTESYRQKQEFLRQIKKCFRSNESKNTIRACIGASILAKYSYSFLKDCSKIFTEIQPPREQVTISFVAICISKHCNLVRKSGGSFIISVLEKIHDYLHSSKSKNIHYFGAELMKNLSLHATKALDASSSMFYDNLLLMFQNQAIDIRLIGFKTLMVYLKLTKQKQYSENLYNQAVGMATVNNYQKHGSLLIFIALSYHFPDSFSEQVNDLLNFANSIESSERYINVASVIFQIVLGAVSKNKKYEEIINKNIKKIWPLNELKPTIDVAQMISFGFKKIPDIMASNINRIIKLVNYLLTNNNNDEQYYLYGAKLMKQLYKYCKNEFNSNSAEIATIFINSKYTLSLVKTLKYVINSKIWVSLKLKIKNLLIRLLEEKNTLFAIKIIPFLPEINQECVIDISPKINLILNEQDINIRKFAPAAILKLSEYQSPSSSYRLGMNLIKQALIEESLEMKLEILKSFHEPYPKYLSFPNVLDSFSVLLHEDSFEVKQVTLKILGGIYHYNPIIIAPIFRSSLLDILYICNSSKSLRIQSEATRCLPIIFSSLKENMPIYVPVFLPIAIQYLKQHLAITIGDSDFPTQHKIVPIFSNSQICSLNSVLSIPQYSTLASSFSTSSFDSRASGGIQVSSPSLKTIGIDAISKPIVTDEQLTFFERIFSTKIATNYIKSIGCICDSNFALIQPNIMEISDLFLTTIGNAAHKKILLSILSVFCNIVDKIGPKEALKIPRLYQILIKLGARVISSEVHTAIFKLLGRLGPSLSHQLQISNEDFKNKDVDHFDLTLPFDDYYIRVVVSHLFFILYDKSEAPFHFLAHQALAKTFSNCSLSINLKRLFISYMNRLFITIRVIPVAERNSYFGILSIILKGPYEWIQPFAGHFFALIEELWNTDAMIELLNLIPQLTNSIKEGFAPYLPRIIVMLLDCLTNTKENSILTKSILRTLSELSATANNFVFIIIRKIVELINCSTSNEIIILALDAIRSIVQRFNCSSYSSSIVRACYYAHDLSPGVFTEIVLQILCSLAISMGKDFGVFKEGLESHKLYNNNLDNILNSKKQLTLNDCSSFVINVINLNEENQQNTPKDDDYQESIKSLEIPINTTTKEQWKTWLRGFILFFIINSPVSAIKNCIPIAKSSPLFARKLFNIGFISCWSHMEENKKEQIQVIVSQALNRQSTPMSVLTALIGLIEFTDRARMPFNNNNLLTRTKLAIKAEKQTFALYCAQLDFDASNGFYSNISLLTQIYTQLGMFDEAQVMQRLSQKNFGTKKQNIFEKLLCLEASEQWEEIEKQFSTLKDKYQYSMILANAFLHLKKWDQFNSILNQGYNDKPESIVMKCIFELSTQNNDISDYIQKGFKLLGQQGGPLFLHGFTAVSPFIVIAQELIELQEFSKNDTSRWKERLDCATCHFSTIRPLLNIRLSILENPDKALPEMLSFLKLARKANEWDAFETFYNKHFLNDKRLIVQFEYLHLLRKKGLNQKALNLLDNMIERKNNEEIIPLLYYRKAKWIASKPTNDEISQLKTVITLCEESSKYKDTHYGNKNLWAWSNMRLYEILHNDENFAINAITGFAKCIEYDTKNSSFDLLQLTNILFQSSSHPHVFQRTKGIIKSIPIKKFIKIIPQLLVYQFSHSQELHNFVISQLYDLLYQYPNSVIFALLFSDQCVSKGKAIHDLLNNFSIAHHIFYESALSITKSLQNACVTLKEYFIDAILSIHNSITSSSFKEKNINKTKKLFNSFKERVINPYSENDKLFVQQFKPEIMKFIDGFSKFLESNNINDFQIQSQINEIKKIYTRVKPSVENEFRLSMKKIAPDLTNIKSNEISVFGTFDPDSHPIYISSFCDDVSVKITKQRPKKIKIKGDNGMTYKFLLKGHEDLRQDERMMQFFDLVNSLIPSEIPKIYIISITPLSLCAGLIQWIPSCDTMHKLITDMRKIDKKELDSEYIIMKTRTHNAVEKLRPIQRLESIRYIMKTTGSNDLRDMIWLKAPDAESWVKHIISFSKTTGLMSIVGYIIGLGDRHPLNIMIQRSTGKVIHVDFGDCFEVTRERVQFAETVPFRLTRMMISVLGPPSIDGSFRKTCESTFKVIREHREAVISILEIFIRDPVSNGDSFENLSGNDVISGSVVIDDWINKCLENENEVQHNLIKKIKRISDKLNALDFNNTVPLTVSEQVDLLINSATDQYNLSCLYPRWNPLW